MVVSEERTFKFQNFSLSNIWPKKVINTQGSIYPFSPDWMVKSLNKETGLDWDICIDVVKGSLKRIARLDLDTIQTSMVRELMCVELSARNYIRERNIYAKLLNRQAVKFQIDPAFMKNYQGQQPDWGPIGYITYKRTYARIMEGKNRTEEFHDTVQRVVEGVFSIQKEHCH